MKNLMAAILMLSAVVGADAQNSVTLYGLVDAGFYRASNTAGGSQSQLASGLMEGSRWGLRGEETLGGGMRAIFTLESRFEADTGSVTNRPISGAATPERLTRGLPAPVLPVAALIGPQQGVNLAGNLFDRQAYLGLITPIGGFLLGRQYTPAYQTFAKYDINKTESAAAPGQLGMLLYPPLEIRRSNALQYVIQQSGVSASLMYAFGESRTATTPASAGSMVGLNVSYDTGPFSAGLGYNTSKDLSGNSSLRSAVVGASYDFGAIKLSGEYVGIKDDNPLLASQLAANPASAAAAPFYKNNLIQDGNLMHLGVSFGVGPGTIKLSYNRLNDKRPFNADSNSVGATYSYALSKRTDLNLILARVSNKDLGQVALGGNGFSGGITQSPGQNSSSFGFGLRHRF
jgi:predicted porin